MKALFEAIREACSPQVWSRGVALVRSEAVSTTESGNELCLCVATQGGLVAPRVILYPGDGDWECDCSSRDDPCEHVAAAAIAVHRARSEKGALPARTGSPGAPGSLRYCLATQPGGALRFERQIVHGKSVTPLTTTLTAIASGRVEGPRFAASQADLAVERVLGSQLGVVLVRREALPRLLDALAGCSDVRLDDAPIRVSAARVPPRLKVEDAPRGFRLKVVPDPAITRSFDNGAVLCGDTLHAVGESRLTGREVEDLLPGRFYSDDEAAQLVAEILPSLERRIPVEIQTRRLPRTAAPEPPRIELQATSAGSALSVLPTLVYGDPPAARIDAGRLVHLRGAVPVRDLSAEERLVRRLRSELGLSPGHRVEVRGEAALDLADRLRGFGARVGGNALARFVRTAPLEARLRVESDTFDLVFESGETGSGGRDGGNSISGGAVLRAWRDGEDWLPLPSGGFAPLPSGWLARHGSLVAELLEARGERKALPRCALPMLAELCDDLDLPSPPGLERLAPLLDEATGVPEAELPGDLTAELRHYQQRGVDWLCCLRDAELGALLADDMGLGKTLQALCALRGRSLVVAPTSVIFNWEEEARRFRPKLRCAVYHGAGRELDAGADLTLTSYAILRLDSEQLCAPTWDCVVLDEAQLIKNPDSQVARAAYRLEARFRLALTGTPVENRLEELWSQIHFLNPGLLGTRRAFRERCARPIAAGDSEAGERLRERLRPFVLRRRKREVAPELPPRTEVVLHCQLSEQERSVYDAVRAAAQRDVVRQLGSGGSVMPALEALLRLRQAACHTGLIPGRRAETSSKLELLLERLRQATEEGHRALVFSQWTRLLDLLEPHLRARGILFSRLDGSTRNRGEVVAGFQDEAGPPILLVSLKAGGTGLNLTAADHVFLLDPWWNPAVEDQAADRTHRIGQQRPVVVHRLVAADTVEEGILELQQAKRSLFDAALADADRAATLSREELLTLLS